MRIIHFSDPHGGGPAEDWMAYFDKRWVGVFNYTFRRRFKHDLSKLAHAVDYILQEKPDLAVCTGDLTSSGQPGEFERVLKILAPLVESDIPVVYTPGNHDCYVRRPKCVQAMKEAVKYLNCGRWGFDDLPRVERLAGCDLWHLNTSRPSNLLCSWGFVDPQDQDFFLNAGTQDHTVPRILITHYPLTEEHPWLRMRHRLFGQKKLVEALHQNVFDLVLCGHVHRPYLKVDAQGRGECCAGSVTLNSSMVSIDVDVEKREFKFKTIAL